jgi:sec-independent protein translocase protein TatA
MFHMPQGWELFIILGVALLIFGKNLPKVGRSLGQGIVEFKKGLQGLQDEVQQVQREADRPITRQ